MRTKFLSYGMIAVLGTAVLGLLGWQRRATADLRNEIHWQRAQLQERARLETEHRRLAAAQATTAELDRLLAERTAVSQLRVELETLRRRANESAAVRRTAAVAPTDTPPSLAGNMLAHQRWRNAGQSSPDAAFETVLWAAAGGDIDTLTGLLALDPEARSQATALFGQLPPVIRQEFSSPERLVAVLTAKDVPLGSATILNQQSSVAGETKVTAQIADPMGKQKVSQFSLRAEGAGWRLVVPANAVKQYAAWLHAPLATVAEGNAP